MESTEWGESRDSADAVDAVDALDAQPSAPLPPPPSRGVFAVPAIPIRRLPPANPPDPPDPANPPTPTPTPPSSSAPTPAPTPSPSPAPTPAPPPLNYEKPHWSGLPRDVWSLEVIKQGDRSLSLTSHLSSLLPRPLSPTLPLHPAPRTRPRTPKSLSLSTLELPSNKEYLVVGRLPSCDVEMVRTPRKYSPQGRLGGGGWMDWMDWMDGMYGTYGVAENRDPCGAAGHRHGVDGGGVVAGRGVTVMVVVHRKRRDHRGRGVVSVSRLHCVLQFHGTDGSLHVYDLGTAHGTRVNKTTLPPHTHHRLHPGDHLRLGASTRTLVVSGGPPPERSRGATGDGDDEDGEDGEDATVRGAPRAAVPVATPTQAEDLHTVTWGFGEDAQDEDGGVEADGGVDEVVEVDEGMFYFKDPKKAIRHWLSNRGYDLDYTFSETGSGQSHLYIATLDLPISDPTSGAPISGTGQARRKRDAEVECALDACKKLDRRGLLVASVGGETAAAKERAVRKKREGDDGDDEYFDRTGAVGRKKEKEKEKEKRVGAGGAGAGAGKGKDGKDKVETYESLSAKKAELVRKIAEANAMVEALQKEHDIKEEGKVKAVVGTFERGGSAEASEGPGHGVEDDMDVEGVLKSLEKKTAYEKVVKAKREAAALAKERDRLNRLLKLVKPSDILTRPADRSATTNPPSATAAAFESPANPPVWPPPQNLVSKTSTSTSNSAESALPPPPVWPPPVSILAKKHITEEEEFIPEEEEEDDNNEHDNRQSEAQSGRNERERERSVDPDVQERTNNDSVEVPGDPPTSTTQRVPQKRAAVVSRQRELDDDRDIKRPKRTPRTFDARDDVGGVDDGEVDVDFSLLKASKTQKSVEEMNRLYGY
ncbi:Kanadaptin [Gonapodya sp. JEL0774]|nr:Kanadaptin [Gonapodya sp. JEL0774]